MQPKFIIYALVEKDTQEIRYIGKSSSGLTRPKRHFEARRYNSGKTYKDNWMREQMVKGLIPEIIILAEAKSEEELNQLEIKLIAEYRQMGARLTNLTDGGEGALGWKPTDETRKNISEARKKYLETLTEPLKAVNKKEHIFIDDIEHKHCGHCDTNQILSNFGIDNSSWDGLNRFCKKCKAEITANKRALNPHKKLTEEELKQSYVDRKDAMVEGLKKSFQDNPELKQRISERNSKPIEGTCVLTGDKIIFKSAKDAKKAGFQNSNIGQAIKYNKPYRGYAWKFKK